MTRVLVCGGRDYGNSPEQKQALIAELDAACRKDRFTAIIEGGAPGADAGARIFADLWSIPLITMRADWHLHGRAAGPIRNQRMIDEGKPDLVIAFPGGRGTADMVRRARAAGIEVREASPHPQHGGGAE